MSTITNEPHVNRVRSGSIQGSRTSSINRIESRTDIRHDYGDRDAHNRHENGHWRNPSSASGEPYAELSPVQTPVIRRFDYDTPAIQEVGPQAALPAIPSPIPPPIITVRSEFPALTRSKAQQSLTCIVTIEVPARKYNHAEGVNAVVASEQDPTTGHDAASQYSVDRQQLEIPPPTAARVREREYDWEKEEILAGITENLRMRVENWHGLDFSRYVHTHPQPKSV